jgi:hypothetical protein
MTIPAHPHQGRPEGHDTSGQDSPSRRVTCTPADRHHVPSRPGTRVSGPAQGCAHLDTAASRWREVDLTWCGAGCLGTEAVACLTTQPRDGQLPLCKERCRSLLVTCREPVSISVTVITKDDAILLWAVPTWYTIRQKRLRTDEVTRTAVARGSHEGRCGGRDAYACY